LALIAISGSACHDSRHAVAYVLVEAIFLKTDATKDVKDSGIYLYADNEGDTEAIDFMSDLEIVRSMVLYRNPV
jgi:hypothetical protein